MVRNFIINKNIFRSHRVYTKKDANNLKNSIKFIALILVCIFSLASFGCGDSKPTAQTQPTTSTQAETQKAAPTPPPKQETQTPAPVEKPAQTEQRYTGQDPNGEGIKGHMTLKKKL